MIVVVFVAMALVAAGIVVAPLAWRGAGRTHADGEADFFRAQMQEIDKDVGRGLLPEAEAAGARTEAGRRWLAALDRPVGEGVSQTPRRKALFAGLVVAALAVAAAVYSQLGSPSLADAPFASRQTAPEAADPLQAALAHIEGEASANPDNVKAWSALAPVYMRMGRYADAAAAFRQLLRLKGEDGEIRADLGEAEEAAAGGVVTPQALADFQKALGITPDSPMARYYLALADEQAGDKAKAMTAYEALVAATADHPNWQRIIQARLSALKGESPPANAEAPAPDAAGGDSQAMIGAMVARLAGRLAQQGGSADEWQRLVRAYTVLGQTDKAQAALAEARKALAADPVATAALEASAKELGVGPEAAPTQAPSDQQAMIQQMVAGLDKRLHDGGGSAEEWGRLIRAYSVLQDPDKAKFILAEARKAYASDTAALGRFDALAQELGL